MESPKPWSEGEETTVMWKTINAGNNWESSAATRYAKLTCTQKAFV